MKILFILVLITGLTCSEKAPDHSADDFARSYLSFLSEGKYLLAYMMMSRDMQKVESYYSFAGRVNLVQSQLSNKMKWIRKGTVHESKEFAWLGNFFTPLVENMMAEEDVAVSLKNGKYYISLYYLEFKPYSKLKKLESNTSLSPRAIQFKDNWEGDVHKKLKDNSLGDLKRIYFNSEIDNKSKILKIMLESKDITKLGENINKSFQKSLRKSSSIRVKFLGVADLSKYNLIHNKAFAYQLELIYNGYPMNIFVNFFFKDETYIKMDVENYIFKENENYLLIDPRRN
ncbi:MAG: hypothetical protein JJT78_16250 [Leptospira sp.]|nr:hypothetical protein [Leptospira sp.]